MKKLKFLSVLTAVTLLLNMLFILPAAAADKKTLGDGTEKTAAEWAAELGVPEQSIVFPSGIVKLPSGEIRMKDYVNSQIAQQACNQITYLPGCTYNLKSFIEVEDGLKVNATGATIYIRSNTSGFFFDTDRKKPKYTNTRDVTIEGGTWIHRASKKPKKPVSVLKFVHAEGIRIRNMNIVTDFASHMVEFIGVNDALIEGCTFTKDKKHYFPSVDEGIQLDIASGGKNAKGIYADNTNCQNITIRNNKLTFFRGIVNNASGANITITGNNINTSKSNGVALYNVQNISVENSVFTNSNSAAVILTKNCKGNKVAPGTMKRLTVNPMKKGSTKITGTKNKTGMLTVIVNGVPYTDNRPVEKFAVNVPKLVKGTVVAFQELCDFGNIFLYSAKVK